MNEYACSRNFCSYKAPTRDDLSRHEEVHRVAIEKIARIKAIRAQFPGMSLVEAKARVEEQMDTEDLMRAREEWRAANESKTVRAGGPPPVAFIHVTDGAGVVVGTVELDRQTLKGLTYATAYDGYEPGSPAVYTRLRIRIMAEIVGALSEVTVP